MKNKLAIKKRRGWTRVGSNMKEQLSCTEIGILWKLCGVTF